MYGRVLMRPEILAGVLASRYRREILLILSNGHLETPSGILKKMRDKGYKTANKQNVSLNLMWLKNNGLVKLVVDRRKGKLYQITTEGKRYVKEIR